MATAASKENASITFVVTVGFAYASGVAPLGLGAGASQGVATSRRDGTVSLEVDMVITILFPKQTQAH